MQPVTIIIMIPADPHGRAPLPIASTEATFDENVDLDYRPAPPKVSIPMSVELEVRGRGMPLPFPLADVPE